MTVHDGYMRRAIEEAKKCIGLTSPNPSVGAVVVRGRSILGTGCTGAPGNAHAERAALLEASEHHSLENATLYVTLEPCCHYGKTPPCTDAIIAAGIRQVVVGMKDPFPKVNSRGVRILRKAGIKVHILGRGRGLPEDIRALNQPYLKWVTTGLPFVTMKAAASLDGVIATRTSDSKWITGPAARQDARRERSRADAVIIGAGAVSADDPELAPDGMYRKKVLLRVIIDPRLETDPHARVFRDSAVLVICTDGASKKRMRIFEKKGIEICPLGHKRISVKRLLQYLGKRHIQHVFVEGGGRVHGTWFDEALVDPLLIDRVLWYTAPVLIGGKDAKHAVAGAGARTMQQAIRLSRTSFAELGNDVKQEFVLNVYE